MGCFWVYEIFLGFYGNFWYFWTNARFFQVIYPSLPNDEHILELRLILISQIDKIYIGKVKTIEEEYAVTFHPKLL